LDAIWSGTGERDSRVRPSLDRQGNASARGGDRPRRLSVPAPDSQQNGGKRRGIHVRITVDLGSEAVTAENADAALSRVFLTSQDRFAEQVPDDWGACVSAAVTGKNSKQLPACRFSPEFAAVPGVGSPSANNPQSLEDANPGSPTASQFELAHIDKGISAPRVIKPSEPGYPEEARQDRLQGFVVLILTVDKAGKPRDIQIVKPLGYGMDQRAVETVATWRFSPALKEGQPIDKEISVEVDFHL
jgi:TonB family protein